MNLPVPQIALASMLGILASGIALAQRQMERLGRGVTATRTTSTQVYVGWRLLGNDPQDIAFNLYRSANGAAAVKINGAAVAASTNYLDNPPDLANSAYTYTVKPVINNLEVPDTWANPLAGGATVPASSTALAFPYLRVPLQPTPDGMHDVKFCWVGDLDGDGEYDFVVDRQPPTAARQFLEAYKRDGTLLWRMNMGPNSTNHYNIEPGSSTISIGHGDNVTVFDMDGDGKSEVLVRTSNGVVFGNGVTLTNGDDRVQFMSVVNGMTGAELGRAQIPNPFLSDGQMNGHMGILYCDGMRPSVFWHSTNRRTDQGFNGMATTWDYRNGAITQRWSRNFNTLTHEAAGHQIRIGDPDNDGKDEYLDVGHSLNDDGTQMFAIDEIVHGDRFHIGDIDPDRPGIETWVIQQNSGSGLATALYESATGAIIKKWYAGGVVDVGRGAATDFEPNSKGYEMVSTQPGIFDAKGNQIYANSFFPVEAIWWDADLSREFLQPNETVRVSKVVNGGLGYLDLIDKNTPAPGAYLYYAGRPAFWGDILGDWREEIVCVENGNAALRIYSTPRVASNRIYTLMHNPQYRAQTTTKGYVQSSMVDYYLGTGMTIPQPPPMVDARLVWRGGAGATTWNNGTSSSWTENGVNSLFTPGDTVRFDISSNNTTTVALDGVLQPGAVAVYSPKNQVIDGTLGSLGGSMKFLKAGAGSLTLSGTHAFTGATTIWDGALILNGTLQSSPLTVWGGTFGGTLAGGLKGGRIGGTGTVSQAVALKYRGAITPGSGMGNAGTLNLGSGLTADDGSYFALDLSNDPSGAVTPSDRIAITGNLALSGKVGLVIKALNGALSPGAYTLVTYTGSLTGNISNFSVTVPPGTPYTLSAGSGAITLTVPVTRAPGAVVWSGSGGAWDLAASQNWLLGGNPAIFVAGDSVTFDATGAANATATLAGALPMAGVTVNAPGNYTFTGSGYLSGTGGLTKSGAGTLTINTNNDFTGPTVVNGGILAIASLGDAGSPSSIGAAAVAASNLVINGGTLRLTGSQTNTNRSMTLGATGGTLDVATANSSMQISGSVGGSGSLVKTGPGTLILTKANTYSGGTTISAGTIYLSGSTANVSGLGTGTVTLNGGTLTMANVQASEAANWNLVVPAATTGRLNADGRCTLNGSLTGSGTFSYYTPFIRTELQGNWSAFTGQINVIGGADGGEMRVHNTFGYGTAAINIGDNAFVYYNNSGNVTLNIGELTGLATSGLGGGTNAGNTVTWRIGGRNTDSTFPGVIVNGTGPVAIIKNGTGTLTLNPSEITALASTLVAGSPTATLTSTAGLIAGMPVSGAGIPARTVIAAVVNATTLTLSKAVTASGSPTLNYTAINTYTGATTVSAGTLRINGGAVGSAITVQSAAALGGTGQVTGNLTIQPGAILEHGTLAAAPLAITGNLTFGTSAVVRPLPGITPVSGTYTILTYTGSLTNTPAFTWQAPVGSNLLATFSTATPGAVTMTLAIDPGTGTPDDLVWTGAASVLWDTATANWFGDGSSAQFTNGTSVSFTESGNAAAAIDITADMEPLSVIVDATKNYTFSGAGKIIGATALAKSGSGTLTLLKTSAHAGGTVINGGTIALGVDSSTSATTIQFPGLNGGACTSLGTGPVTVSSGGQLRLGGRGGGIFTFTIANPISFDQGNLVSRDGVQALTGGVTVLAGGSTWTTAWANKNLFINSALNGSGPIAIDDAIANGSDTGRALVRVAAADNTYSGTITVNGPSAGFHGGVLQVENNTALANATIVTNNTTVPGLTFTVTTPQIGALGGSGNVVLPATSLTTGGNNASTSHGGVISGSGALVKSGTGIFTLAGANTYTGTTTVSTGKLLVTGSLANTATTIATTATLGGTGTIAGAVTCNGTLAPGTSAGTLTLSNGLVLAPTSVLAYELGTVSDRVNVTGDLTLAGTLNVTAAPGFGPGTYILLTYTGALPGVETLNPGSLPAGFEADIDTDIPNQIRLIVTAILTPFEEWQMEYFGSTTHPDAAATADPDGDGTSNETEFRLGLDPNNGSSSFKVGGTLSPGGFTLTWPSAPGLTFEVRRSATLQGEWELLETLAPITPGPATHTDTDPLEPKSFYRIILLP